MPTPTPSQVILLALRRDLRFAYHECLPLGWRPVPVGRTYYPGYTASVQGGGWLDALWRGRILKRELRNRDAADVFAVLNRLTRAGMLLRQVDTEGYRYTLTPHAFSYFYNSSVFHDNRDGLPYLCYSIIVPNRVQWISRIAAANGAHSSRWYDAEFAWKPSAAAPWADDQFIRSHSVTLAPLTSPAIAKFEYRRGQWYIANLYDRTWMLPALDPASVRQP